MLEAVAWMRDLGCGTARHAPAPTEIAGALGAPAGESQCRDDSPMSAREAP
jgi:hypothetical protein